MLPNVFPALLLAALFSAADSQPANLPPLPAEGKTALLVLPSSRPDGQPTAPAGFTLHLSPAGDADEDLVFPAGEWQSPPPGDYWAFVEGPQSIGPSLTRLGLVARRGEDPVQVAILPVGEAGQVEIASPFPPTAGMVARLIGLESPKNAGEPREVFSRSLPLDVAAPATALPVGRAFAAVYSRRLGAYLALSRPFAVEKGKTARTAPQAPGFDRADFLLVLEKSQPSGDGLALELHHPGGKGRKPDLLVSGARRVYAVWYGLPPGAHRLVTGSGTHSLADRLVELRGGEVGHLEVPLDRRPDVKVRLELPEGLRRAGPLTLLMRSLKPPALPDPWNVASGAKEMLLEKVPPGLADFTLLSPAWAFKQRLDLRGGEDGELLFAPYETEIHGTLTSGGKAAPGKIRFTLPDQPSFEVKTDAEGNFHLPVWRHGLYEIGAEVAGRQPYRQRIEIPEVPKKALEIDVPQAGYVVRAVDRETRRPLPVTRARYSFSDGEGHEWKGRLQPSGGQAPLPPLGEGKLDLEVAAEGYEEGELEGLELDPKGPDAEVVVELEPITSWVHLQMLRGLDEPVAGAELRVLYDGLSGEIAWEGKSDRDGLAKVPAGYAGLPLLARSPGHAFLVDVLPESNVAPTELRLGPRPANEKTVVVVVDEENQPITGAEVLLGFGQVWLRGEALTWLVGNAGRGTKTNGYGLMILLDLPSQELALMASAEEIDPDKIGALANLATRVDSPPPRVLVVPVLPYE